MSNQSIRLRFSGGAFNTQPHQSLGGAVSASLGGVPTGQSVSWVSGTQIPGLTFIGATGIALGNASVVYTHANGVLVWEDASMNSVAIDCNSSGYKRIAYNGGEVLFYADATQIPAQNFTATYHVKNRNQNLFKNVTPAQRAAGKTVYRCLFIENTTAQIVDNVQVAVTDGTVFGSISLGTEFGESGPEGYVEDDYWSSEYEGAEGAPQISDGISVDLPFLLVDEYDSTNQLSGIVWGSTVVLTEIPPNKFGSFWVRYMLAAASSGVNLEEEFLQLQVTYKRTL